MSRPRPAAERDLGGPASQRAGPQGSHDVPDSSRPAGWGRYSGAGKGPGLKLERVEFPAGCARGARPGGTSAPILRLVGFRLSWLDAYEMLASPRPGFRRGLCFGYSGPVEFPASGRNPVLSAVLVMSRAVFESAIAPE